MAWWDYGYQISGVANRTTIADGNTWNHEHIALLGKRRPRSRRDANIYIYIYRWGRAPSACPAARVFAPCWRSRPLHTPSPPAH